MNIPEVTLYNLVKSATALIQSDFSDNTADLTQSYLYDIFGLDPRQTLWKLDKFIYFEEAKKLFIAEENSPRLFEVHLGYNMAREGRPTIHILLPSEEVEPVIISAAENYYPDSMSRNPSPGMVQFKHQRRQSVTYNLLCTSRNYQEVVLLYHYLKYVFTAMVDQLEFYGLQNSVIGGSDLTTTPDLVPEIIFHRNFAVSFTYEFQAWNFIKQQTTHEVPGDVDYNPDDPTLEE
jgi:hypothetical protein